MSMNDMFLGRVFNGYDYALQVWVKVGIIQRCGHPLTPCAPVVGRAAMPLNLPGSPFIRLRERRSTNNL